MQSLQKCITRVWLYQKYRKSQTFNRALDKNEKHGHIFCLLFFRLRLSITPIVISLPKSSSTISGDYKVISPLTFRHYHSACAFHNCCLVLVPRLTTAPWSSTPRADIPLRRLHRSRRTCPVSVRTRAHFPPVIR